MLAASVIPAPLAYPVRAGAILKRINPEKILQNQQVDKGGALRSRRLVAGSCWAGCCWSIVAAVTGGAGRSCSDGVATNMLVIYWPRIKVDVPE